MTLQNCLLAGAAATLVCVASWADDAPSRATPTDHQMMKTCIQKQKTADVTLSKSQMTQLCKDELKRQKTIGETTPPPVDSARPQN